MPAPNGSPNDADALADAAVSLVADWLNRAVEAEQRSDRIVAKRLADLMDDPEAVAFTMRFVDRVARPESNKAAAKQLAGLVSERSMPAFLAPIDRLLLRTGALIGRLAPGIVMPTARARMRSLVGHLVADADPEELTKHLDQRRRQGYAMNVNLLGEAILGEREAARRFERTLATVRRTDVDYVSVKISSVASQLNLWAFEDSLERIVDRLRKLYDAGASTNPPTFINLDMEEYKDLDLTIDAFTHLLDERPQLDAGIVLQTYLPDTFVRLQRLLDWANARHRNGGGSIKIRLVKGANLAMERVDAEIHGWEQTPYATKVEADANFKRCLDFAVDADRLDGVTIGVGSHNLFDVAWALLLARQRGVADRVQFEMLQGMAPSHSKVVRDDSGGMLLYTPVVAAPDFEVAIGYLFRRLEENASPENFLHALFSLEPGSPGFAEQERGFRESLGQRWSISVEPRRRQNRLTEDKTPTTGGGFTNEPDTDAAIPDNRSWGRALLVRPRERARTPLTETVSEIDRRLQIAREASAWWGATPPTDRAGLLRTAGDALAARRGDLVAAMVHEGSKTLAQADPEVSEAIDFARYYAWRALDLEDAGTGRFTPLGVVAVIPPWNFPVAIPAGGVLAALAAGNSVIFKPAPETPRCAEIVAEACWKAGVPEDVLQFVRTPDNEVGRQLVTNADGVILTGSWDTARLFQSWKPDIRLFAETSGKNALIVTAHADLDLAAADLALSAFGHSGQKCSAASLAILVGDVSSSPRFRRQLLDATESMTVGATTEPATDVGPLIVPASGPLEKALTDGSADWFMKPKRLDEHGRLWSPGILDNVQPGSWFHQTECFGPVLGLMHARDLDHAIELQNQSPFGLTGGIHTLDPRQVDHWLDRVDVGNAYVNRPITGAIVNRQPFGGRKRSSIGPGAKAGGPNYVAQLGGWHSESVPDRGEPISPDVRQLLAALQVGLTSPDAEWLQAVAADDEHWWENEFGRMHDPSGLVVESNIFRYQPRRVTIRVEDASNRHVARTLLAARRAGAQVSLSSSAPVAIPDSVDVHRTIETFEELTVRLPRWSRVRLLGDVSDATLVMAHEAEVDIQNAPVAASGRREMQWYFHEQAISRTMHRFGNLV